MFNHLHKAFTAILILILAVCCEKQHHYEELYDKYKDSTKKKELQIKGLDSLLSEARTKKDTTYITERDTLFKSRILRYVKTDTLYVYKESPFGYNFKVHSQSLETCKSEAHFTWLEGQGEGIMDIVNKGYQRVEVKDTTPRWFNVKWFPKRHKKRTKVVTIINECDGTEREY